MLHDTPSLKARQLGWQLGWQDLLAPEVARRLGVSGEAPDPRPRALVAAALGCLNAAVDVWTASDGTTDLADLVDQAMNAVAGETGPHAPRGNEEHRMDRWTADWIADQSGRTFIVTGGNSGLGFETTR